MPEASLYLVATPIGNLDDIVPRAITALQTVDAIACEDTRHSAKLLKHYAINKPLIAYHDHNEQDAAAYILGKLQAGQSIALISDAGTPAIADPGYRLVRLAHQAGVRVVSIPGACAFVTALAGSGLASDRFTFNGFLPAKQTARCAELTRVSGERATQIFYEAPHRLKDTVTDMVEVLGGEREVCLARELTKTFETLRHSTLSNLLAAIEAGDVVEKGEIALIVAGCLEAPRDDSEVDRVLSLLLAHELPVKQASSIAAELTGLGKRELYQRALQLKDQ